MTNTASSAMPMPVKDSAPQKAALGSTGPVLTFAPSTKFSPLSHRRTTSSHESDEAGSDPDDLLTSQIEQDKAKLKRDIAERAIEKEKEQMCGFLYKKAGGAGKAWNKRWCVLRSQALSIYKNNSEYKLKRIIRADEIEAVCAVEKRNHPFAFMVGTRERSFYFEASSKQELELWVDAVQRVVLALSDNGSTQPTRPSHGCQKKLDEEDRDLANTAGSRQYATTSRMATASPPVASGDAFLSLPSASGVGTGSAHGTSQRNAAVLRPAQSIFPAESEVAASKQSSSNNNGDGNSRDAPTSISAQPIQPDTPAKEMSTSSPGLRVDTSVSPRYLSKQGGDVRAVSEATEVATALPPGVDPEHEPVPVAEEEGEAEEDDEPNFNVDQRREIENKLAEDQVILSGYLLKQDKLRQWRKRWFVLRRNTLSYYHNKKEYELKQILRPSDIYAIREPDPCTAKAKSLRRGYFKVVTVKRSYWLAHDDIVEAARWFQTLEQWKDGALDRPAGSKPLMSPTSPNITQSLSVQNAAAAQRHHSHQGQQPRRMSASQSPPRGEASVPPVVSPLAAPSSKRHSARAAHHHHSHRKSSESKDP
ncbi:PH-domain-containing protein [Martensiomyces pterosporus]|nr:PH-domain-containing protein [Martensiomyces pterosporus]